MATNDYIVEMFDEIVTNVRSDYDPTNGLEPYYDYGHMLNILKRLTLKDKNGALKFRKYPLIALITDIDENHLANINYKYEFSPRILILDDTKQEYNDSYRMENIFKPKLYPIYNYLINNIKNYHYFDFRPIGKYDHTKTDRMNWGSSNIFGNIASQFNDVLDGMEIITNTPIKVKKSLCL